MNSISFVPGILNDDLVRNVDADDVPERRQPVAQPARAAADFQDLQTFRPNFSNHELAISACRALVSGTFQLPTRYLAFHAFQKLRWAAGSMLSFSFDSPKRSRSNPPHFAQAIAKSVLPS